MMPDPIDRLRSLGTIPVPDLWPVIETRARQRAAAGVTGPLELPAARRRAWFVPRHAIRPLRLAAAGLVTVVIAGALIVSQPSSALAIIDGARSSFAAIPPFRATISVRTSRDVIAAEIPSYDGPDQVAIWRVSYAGPEAWRRDVVRQEPSLPPGFGRGDAGSFEVWDGTSLGIYRAETNRFHRQPTAAGFDPLGELGWASADGSWSDHCADSDVLPDEPVAGRTARHVRCGEMELWIDAETGLMLRITNSAFRQEITDVEYVVEFGAETFRVAAPAGATEEAEPTLAPAAGLEAGTEAFVWSGPLLRGGTFRLDELRGRPTVVFFWADWCPDACASVFPAFAQVAAESASDAHFVAVDYEGSSAFAADWLSEWVGSADWTFPIVIDDGRIGEAWGISAVPTWVLLDADGRFVEARAGHQTADGLRELLDRATP